MSRNVRDLIGDDGELKQPFHNGTSYLTFKYKKQQNANTRLFAELNVPVFIVFLFFVAYNCIVITLLDLGYNKWGSSKEQKNLYELQSLVAHQWSVNDVAFSPDGKSFISAAGDGSVRLWELETGKQLNMYQVDGGQVVYAVFHPNGGSIFVSTKDNIIRQLDIFTGREKRRFVGHGCPATMITFTVDNEWMISGACFSSYIVWHVWSGEKIALFDTDKQGFNILSFNHGTQKLFMNYQASAWDISRTRSPEATNILDGDIQHFDKNLDIVTSIAVSPDHQQVAIADYTGAVSIWDIKSGVEVERFLANAETYTHQLIYTPDYLLALSSIRIGSYGVLWDVTAGKILREFRGHTRPILSMTVSSNQQLLLTGSEDFTVRLWEMPELP